jgi:hypothetical protein
MSMSIAEDRGTASIASMNARCSGFVLQNGDERGGIGRHQRGSGISQRKEIGPSSAGWASGSETVNLDPDEGTLVTVISPP